MRAAFYCIHYLGKVLQAELMLRWTWNGRLALPLPLLTPARTYLPTYPPSPLRCAARLRLPYLAPSLRASKECVAEGEGARYEDPLPTALMGAEVDFFQLVFLGAPRLLGCRSRGS